VHRGVAQLADAYRQHGLTVADIESGRFLRLRRLRQLLDGGRLGTDLRWQASEGITEEGTAIRDGRTISLPS
jgi:hypothetical protein